ncbi:uncharacterized protein EURHEDRAFT_458581 [Aspergillus ruber CBS 135680]|uniref:RFTS domain-containing protein n=1 Tax=Aspergillus ruber (strain CBS 135680) TaxID=1388766 RepID=A0A017SBB3_ASPRC|nr:uncharacterized protein EURHEDRAFT_458581 [Aspergillus ruber CBS 135680]EYE94076.1 hypothetical protein EURHEDRAFT_458581 [Aspergillus ruber CBS 135680]
MTSREDSVLAARDPSLVDENDWEEFSLSEVRILVPGKSRYANLLAASPENPVQVTGCLDEVEEEQESLVLDEEYQSKRIVVENVTHYAYGQHNDGEVGIWVAGRAGWFSISPAKGYRPLFNEIVEAIDLLYFLADRHQKKRNKRKDWNPSVEYLCEEYVSHTHGICEDMDDSAEVFYKYHGFLLSRMIKGEEGVQWTKSNIFEHLCENFPETYEEIKAENEAKENEKEQTPEEQVETHSTPEKKNPPPDPATVPQTQADTIYQIIIDLKEAGYLAKRELNLDLVISTVVDRFEIGSREYAVDLVAARAKNVLKLMDEAKTAHFDWSRKAIYRELKSATKRKRNPEDITLTPLRPRSNDKDESSNEESEEQDDHPRHRRRRVRKSVLRPKISSVSAKQIGKRTRSIAAVDDDGYLSDEHPHYEQDNFETPSKIRGHELVRDPLSTTRAKRTRSVVSDADIHSKTPLRKLVLSRNTPAHGADLEREPTAELDDIWTCQFRGCEAVVEHSSSIRGQELVEDHRASHEVDTQTKLDLVFAEKQLNVGMPVDNLLSRIREMGVGLLGEMENAASANEA